MNKFVWIVSIFISSSAFAGSCGVNCYQGDINGDKKADKMEFVIAGKSSLNLKLTTTGTKTLIKAHDKYQEPTTNVQYIPITDTADIFEKFLMTVLEGQKTVNLQWKETEGHFGLKKFQIQANGKLIPVSDNGE